jgi:alpha-L-fucosidase 2
MNNLKRISSILVLIVLYIAGCSGIEKKETSEQQISIWFDTPAIHWEEALPIGNGTQGAMIYGGVAMEEYQLNDHTLWAGGPSDWNNPNAREMLPLIREAVFQEDYLRADTLWDYAKGPYTARYVTAGSLMINFDLDTMGITNYRRELNLEEGLSQVSFQIGESTFQRESFASYPDKSIIVRLTASNEGSLNFSSFFNNDMPHRIEHIGNDHIYLRSKAPSHVAHRAYEPQQIVYEEDGEGMFYETHLKILETDGELIVKNNELKLQNASNVVLAIITSTSFNGYDKSPVRDGKNPHVEAMNIINGLQGQHYNTLRERHVDDFSALFSTASLDLGNTERRAIHTGQRLLEFNQGITDNDLITTFFQFGRYLLISSSRPGTVAANLQGLWNQRIQPPWGSNYTMNINTQMNYWPAEATRLSECHEPLFELIEKLATNGSRTAEINYGAQGWVAHHNSDIWGQTAPAGGLGWDSITRRPFWACWQLSGGWFCQHLWTRYEFTGDKKFLKERAWPLMRGSVLFYMDWLIEGPTGELVTIPSTSPENQFDTTLVAHGIHNDSYLIRNGNTGNGKFSISMASTMDMAIIRELFVNSIKALDILGEEQELKVQIQEALDKLYAPRIGKHGQLQEWYKDWDNVVDDHRHVSHLYGAHPGYSIQPRETPQLAEAVKKSLQLRGDGGTGWARAWKINFWARLEDGEHAYTLLKQLFNPIDMRKPIDPNTGPDNRGGLHLNLLCTHPPFQIDGNFGGTAGITEMLLQSHTDAIHLLPALPKVWHKGALQGFRTKGGFVIDMAWDKGEITALTIKSEVGGNCRIRVNHLLKETSRMQWAVGDNPNPLFDNWGFVEPVISEELKEGASPLKVNEVFEYDIDTKKGEVIILIS